MPLTSPVCETAALLNNTTAKIIHTIICFFHIFSCLLLLCIILVILNNYVLIDFFKYIISITQCVTFLLSGLLYTVPKYCISNQCSFPIMLFVRYLILFTEHNIWSSVQALYCSLSIIQSNILLGETLT